MFRATLLLFVLSSFTPSSWASRARLEALGQNAHGSYFINDARNIFYNPAEINKSNRGVSFEWGASGDAEKVDSQATPRGEGLYLDEVGAFNMGLALGYEDDEIIGIRNLVNDDFLKPDNTVTLFLGNDAGTNWGASLFYSKNESEAAGFSQTESTIIAGGGVKAMDDKLGVFGNFYFSNEAEGATTEDEELKGGLGLFAGANYSWTREITFFGGYGKMDLEYDTGVGDADVEVSHVFAGVARKRDLNDKSFFFYSAEVEQTKFEVPDADVKANVTSLPITIGLEGEANSWMTLRGSVSQKVLLNKVEEDDGTGEVTSSDEDTTTVGGGLSLYFGNFQMDGSFTTTAGTLNADNVMSRVSMNFNF